MNRNDPLKHLMPGWFTVVMGWAGLSLAWYSAQASLGELAATISLLAGALAALLFLLLLAATLWRWRRHPQAVADDLQHPVRHAFVAAVPVSALLLATVAVAHGGPAARGVEALWWAGSLSQFAVTLWVLARWLRGTPAAGASAWNWAAVTPALFIPVVGNVAAPLAGLPLGHGAWAAAQFGVGLLFWPLVLLLVVLRIAHTGMLPERLLPTLFIFATPPALIGLDALQFGAAPALAWMLWGMALFQALWVATLARRIAGQPFGVPHWGMSFPLAALATLTLRLADTAEGRWLAVPAIGLLALVSLLVLALTLATLRGLREQTLLVPESAPVIPLKVQA